MADITVRPASAADFEALLDIEYSAMPNFHIFWANRKFLFGPDNDGEMVLALADGVPVGMGQYTAQPDGAGWLEVLRVKKEWQRKGVGMAIYKRYLEIGRQRGAPSLAMYTGRTNLASKGLAERNGFALSAAVTEYSADPAAFDGPAPAFSPLRDPALAAPRIEAAREAFGPYLALNRTYYHWGMPLYAWLCARGMVYANDDSILVLGTRMLEERGLQMPFFAGDAAACLAFAAARAKKTGLPAVTATVPARDSAPGAALAAAGWKRGGEIIVLSRNMRENP